MNLPLATSAEAISRLAIHAAHGTVPEDADQ
jgi:hypothetical protein